MSDPTFPTPDPNIARELKSTRDALDRLRRKHAALVVQSALISYNRAKAAELADRISIIAADVIQ